MKNSTIPKIGFTPKMKKLATSIDCISFCQNMSFTNSDYWYLMSNLLYTADFYKRDEYIYYLTFYLSTDKAKNIYHSLISYNNHKSILNGLCIFPLPTNNYVLTYKNN